MLAASRRGLLRRAPTRAPGERGSSLGASRPVDHAETLTTTPSAAALTHASIHRGARASLAPPTPPSTTSDPSEEETVPPTSVGHFGHG